MSMSVSVRDLTLKYGDTEALSKVSFDLEPGKIYGLLGRNGAGKTTLMSVIAAFRRATEGQVLLDGKVGWENADLLSRVCLIREGGDFIDSDKLRDVFDVAQLRPSWDSEYAEKLVDKFAVDSSKRIDALSRGQRSIVAGIVGLASRADLTMFDEVHLGMDAPTRYDFYQELLADYLENPRTIVLSTHLIDEVAKYLEEVLIIHRGELLRHDTAEKLQTMGASLTGPARAVDEVTDGLEVLASQQLGSTKQVTVSERLDPQRRKQAAASGIEMGPVGLQDLFIHLTRNTSRE
ncbi:ATP-binding cassette domain-containing protein [Natronoglycomyces albus]|uniref:ABC transporter ATP-binding protein n=1 Tax=Natronoglycomyces albus TaxID=2811108 RepID=A0A895XMP2_9ACTN|nr:ABC transporter ATP-binding protein [Natronoglycomyces albus]QSB06624.1 ABC transporter ATP-binding protein [Natronoglycomyces albus]